MLLTVTSQNQGTNRRLLPITRNIQGAGRMLIPVTTNNQGRLHDFPFSAN